MVRTLEIPPRSKPRFTIGLLDDNVYDDFHNQLMMGVFEAARKYDVNIVRFGAFSPFIDYIPPLHNGITLSHIEQYELDGLMFLGWSKAGPLFNHDDFTARFQGIPVLSIGSGFEDIPFLYFPGDKYVRELLLHLINVHKFSKIAYIEPFHQDNRNSAYINTMRENGLYNPDLYISQEDLGMIDPKQRGKKAVSLLLDDRKAEFDAILSLFIMDTEVIMNELKSRGLNVPKDVALVSYEAGEFGKYSSPGITTVEFPWMELGFHGCEKMVELLSTGHIPFSTMVPGRIIYQGSCGCMSNSVNIISGNKFSPSGKNLKNISESEKKSIVSEMAKAFRYTNINFEKLLDAFLDEYNCKRKNTFLNELNVQFRNSSHIANYSNAEDIISVFRKLVMPYLVNEKEERFWSGDVFQQAQVLVREKIARINVYEKANEKIMYQTLLEISRLLVTKFNKRELLHTLKESLPKLGIQSCYLFLFDRGNINPCLFENCTLEFEYNGTSERESVKGRPVPAKDSLKSIFKDRNKAFAFYAHILHVADDFIGFILFEPGPMGERAYQYLSACLSTALSGSFLLSKLDLTYKKLIEQAEREGMAEIATGILHNIGNILNSVNASVHMMHNLAGSSTFEDFYDANMLLESNMDNLDDFIRKDVKAKKLMQFYLRLGPPFAEIQQQIMYHTTRLSEKVNSINEIIISQQNYAGVNTTLEELDITSVLEDVVMLHSASVEKYHIQVLRDYQSSPRVRFQRIKLFHILVNLINNAIEAMTDSPSDSRALKFTVSRDDSGKYIRITDNGCGIPESLIDKIFLDGYTTKKGRQGIGLNSCASYMSEMGGQIIAESDGPGTGATFILKFK